MKTTLTTYDIANALLADDNANWSRAGAFALAEWLEEMERDTGEEMDLDVVAIRCDFSEYESLQDWACEYWGTTLIEACESMGIDEATATSDYDEDINEAIRDYINDNGWLIEFDGGIIVSSF